ncbi:B12-binding domain-containing radical SAM protein [Gudongella sp. DL1XJH-153]|uniref:B12-binding domain-containing radical SAM protein n=1 Tax=Gudongella sp. DL1XJH-153 TaxID=3409804 RepID=UPI003BB4F85B
MLIFLEKVRKRTVFSIFEPIITEPLELLYLKSVLDKMGIKNRMVDPLFKLKEPENEIPDLVILTGYNTAQDEIKLRAAWWKKRNKETLVMVAGVHIQLNRTEFRQENIDLVFHSQDLTAFRDIVSIINKAEMPESIDGVDINIGEGKWSLGNTIPVEYPEKVNPSRKFFEKHRQKLRYVDKRDLALIKGGRGCPYGCSYCYCRSLNDNVYVKPDFREMFGEMKEIDADNFWIVDDVLLTDTRDALQFIKASNETGFTGSIIAYLRADFIAGEKYLLPELYKAGLHEVIIGFETPDEKELLDYNKRMANGIYSDAISLLRENNISLTALFMVHPDYDLKEFLRLWRFIGKNGLDLYTISIFTPLQGSDGFEEYNNKLITKDPGKFDFLHLVLPSKLPKPIFYILFYLSHARLLLSRRIWKYIFAR